MMLWRVTTYSGLSEDDRITEEFLLPRRLDTYTGPFSFVPEMVDEIRYGVRRYFHFKRATFRE